MQLLIVLVNYRGADLTIDCLRSLEPELAALPGVRVGLCDNGSGDDEVERLASAVDALGLADRVALTPIFPNQGFTGGNNVVIRQALAGPWPPDAVLLLNNDTLVRPGAVQQLVEFFEQRPAVGVAGSRLEYPDGASQRAARRTLSIGSEFEAYARLGVVSRLLARWLVAPPDDACQPMHCDWVPGAALMIRREVLERIGLLDEDLYTYFDDVDFCLRAARAGWPTWYVPASRIVHLVGQTTGVTQTAARPQRRPEYWFCARRHFFLKNHGPAYAVAADLAAIAGLLLWKIRGLASPRPDADPPRLLRDFLRTSVLTTGFRRHPVNNPLTGAPVSSTTATVATPRAASVSAL